MKNHFKNILFSITVNNGSEQKATSVDSTPDSEGNEHASYNELGRIIEELGGKVCATVHKNVDYLVASRGAVSGATQRVRKAVKFQVPILNMKYILDVHTKNINPGDVSSYIFSSEEIAEGVQAYLEASSASSSSLVNITEDSTSEQQNEGMNAKKDVKKKKKKRKIEDTTPSVSSYQTPSFVSSEVFDCSCICHDRGEVSCSWCLSAHTSAVVSDVSSSERNESNEVAVVDAAALEKGNKQDQRRGKKKRKRIQ